MSTTARVVMASVFALFACAQQSTDRATPLAVREAWSRTADSGATGVVYASLHNTQATAVTIAGITSPDAEQVELHESMQMGGMVHMTARPSITIAPDSVLDLKPAGLHIMLTALRRPLHAGDSVSASIVLQDGRTIPLHAVVRAP